MNEKVDLLTNIFFLILGIFSLFYLGMFYFKGGTVDDSFIIYRYVDNLTSGYGFRWNTDGDRVQGFTSMGWVLVLYLTNLFVEIQVHEYAPYVGLIFGGLSVLFAFLAARRISGGNIRFFSFLVPLTISLSPMYVRHAINGLETGMVFLTVSITCFIATFSCRRKSYILCMSIITIFSGLVRPDLIIFPATVYTSIEIYKSDSVESFLSRSYIYYSVSFFLGTSYLLWKYHYFGDIFPLPAYMKSNPARNIYFFKHIVAKQLKFLAYASVPILLSIMTLYKSDSYKPEYLGIVASSLVFGIYLFTIDVEMNFDFRHQMTLFIPSVIISLVGLGTIVNTFGIERSQTKICFVLICLLLVFCNIGRFTHIRDTAFQQHTAKQGRVELAQKVRSIGNIKVAGSYAGKFPYYSKAKYIDILGLNTKFVAYNRYTSKDFEKKFSQYISNEKPDIYMGYYGKNNWENGYTFIGDDPVYRKYEPVCLARQVIDHPAARSGLPGGGFLILKTSNKYDEIKEAVKSLSGKDESIDCSS